MHSSSAHGGVPGRHSPASTSHVSAPLQNTPSSQSASTSHSGPGGGGFGVEPGHPYIPTSSARPSTMPKLKSNDRFRLLSVLLIDLCIIIDLQ